MFLVVVYFQVKKERRAGARPASSSSAPAHCQFAVQLSSKGKCVHSVASWLLILYLKDLSIFLSLPLSFPCSPFSVLLLFPLLQSALGCTCYGGDSSTANTDLQPFFIATVLCGVWIQKNQIARKPEKSVSGKSGEQVCGSVNSRFFLPLLIIMIVNNFLSYSSHSSEVWEEKKEMSGLFKVANFVLGRRGILIRKYQIPVSLASPATPFTPIGQI